ncbi:RICIN domain-containing protein [Streptomyces sp. NPDC088124]|uniref:RICIN domain-containing protein n=1 Tax=Streptomyces sp. NPDC088124 TaxID=3154654 RepID=UPI003425CA41
MGRVRTVLLALCVAAAGFLLPATAAQGAEAGPSAQGTGVGPSERGVAAGPVSVTNGGQFTDTGGQLVHAHGGGVIKVGSWYYWFGENRNADNTFRYVSAYRSADLKTWEFRRHVLTQATDPELAAANIERPKVVYNAATGRFVMWMHKESATDYSQARAAVATSATVDGDYAWKGSFRPLGTHMSRDITVFTDTDGTGYMVSAARENYDLQIYRLTSDYTAVESLVANPWPGGHREAPALFKRGGVYFMLTSGATGWNPNQQQYATATSLAGPWSAMRNVGDSTAYNSQTAYVLPLQGTSGTSYLYLGDRWGNSFGQKVNDSRYVWLPLAFPTSTSLTMDWYPELTIDTAAGTVTGSGGPYETLTARHSGKCADVPNQSVLDGVGLTQYTCNGGGNQRFWFKNTGDGYAQLTARHSSLCLTETAADVQQRACGGAAEQQWRVAVNTSGYTTLTSRASGECLDVTSASVENSARIITHTCTGATNQQWQRST